LRPRRHRGYEAVKFLGIDGIFRHFTDEFVVAMKNDAETGGFDAQHRLCEDISADCRNDIFRELAAVEALVAPLAGGVILVDNAETITLAIYDQARVRVGKLAAGRQLQV